MQTQLSNFESQNVAVIGISANTVEELSGKMQPKGFTFPLLADPELKAIDAYGLRHKGGNPMTGGDISRPAVILIDENGKVLEVMLTENWRVRPTPEMILEKLESKSHED